MHIIDYILDLIYNIVKMNIDAPVAQLDRVADFESVGWGFESLRVHHGKTSTFIKMGSIIFGVGD